MTDPCMGMSVRGDEDEARRRWQCGTRKFHSALVAMVVAVEPMVTYFLPGNMPMLCVVENVSGRTATQQ